MFCGNLHVYGKSKQNPQIFGNSEYYVIRNAIKMQYRRVWFSNNKSIIKIVCFGIAIHILLLIAVFDTYFKSPLEHGMTPVQSIRIPPSKRLVLFVADGLRAQAILDENEHRTPFLTSIRKHKGSWGVSHTRVPTESRPGHVAMLAGIYEDPSAIFKGWKHNPVDFDSVINQSSNAWCIGSPDIVTIFNKDGRKHIHTHSYDAEMQDFGNKATIILDRWVFDKTKWVLNSFKDSDVFKQPGNVFFLHLLGLDTAGHAFKPHSKEYIENIKFVDHNIEITTKLFNEIFQDQSTSFIFTSDHGMTDWGSHGSGLDHETYTPFVAWGSGVKINNERQDINQIDIAPLISSLIGINYPTNNLGKLPHAYLDLPDTKKVQNFLTNVQQIFKIFIAKQEKIEKSALFYKPYKYVTASNFDKNFTELWHSNKSQDVILKKCETLFEEILKAIDYCHNYFTGLIVFVVSLGLFFWILYLSTYFFDNVEIDDGSTKNTTLKVIIIMYNGLSYLMCQEQSFSVLNCIYFIFPTTILYFLSDRTDILYDNLYPKFSSSKFLHLIYFTSCILFFIFGFHYRICFSFLMILISFSFFLDKKNEIQIGNNLKIAWITICIILAFFPALPLMFTYFHIVYFAIGYFLWLLFSLRIFNKEFGEFKLNQTKFKVQKYIFYIQIICFNLSFLNSVLISFDYFENSSLLKHFSWGLFIVPLICIPFSIKVPEVRIYTIFLGFAPFYLMTTMCYELIFLTIYCVHLMLWMKIEKRLKAKSNRHLETFRKCLMFMSTILIGFFGTGNIASLNSFDPMWVRCFLTVFSPFMMTILIFVKLVIPFLFSTVVFRDIVIKTGMNLTSSFCTILLISDLMVFYFMYHIKNVGSWLEIGMSLSHFIVVECFTIGILILYFVAYLLTNVQINQNVYCGDKYMTL